jgi:DNA-binding PadR family transcriptional regulator
MPTRPDPQRPPVSLLPLSPQVYQILLSLADRDLHGYAIIADVRDRTEGEVQLTASTLYAALARLLAQRLVEEIDERPPLDDARRRYYRVTAFGRAVLRAEAERLERCTAMAREKRLLPRLRAARSEPRR